MSNLVMIKLTKHFGPNVIGETAGFSPEAAEHIQKHNGGEVVAKFDSTTHRFDRVTGKAVKLEQAA